MFNELQTTLGHNMQF